MRDKPVQRTQIASKVMHTDAGGRQYAVMEILCDKPAYQPGQYVMIKRDDDSFRWSYPHLILKTTDKGLKVVASSAASLFRAREGDNVQLWGANGRGVDPQNAVLVAEPATYFLIAPLVSALDGCELVAVGGKITPVDGEKMTVREVADAAAAAKLLAESGKPVFAALNLPTLLAMMEGADDALKARTTIFASVEIGCGTDACKGCYLHSPDIRVGFPVCCEGPYLAYNRIDFATDSRCFQLFE